MPWSELYPYVVFSSLLSLSLLIVCHYKKRSPAAQTVVLFCVFGLGISGEPINRYLVEKRPDLFDRDGAVMGLFYVFPLAVVAVVCVFNLYRELLRAMVIKQKLALQEKKRERENKNEKEKEKSD